MKWLTYRHPLTKQQRAGFLLESHIIDLEKSLLDTCSITEWQTADGKVLPPPVHLLEYIRFQETYKSSIQQVLQQVRSWASKKWTEACNAQDPWVFPFKQELLRAPLPTPSSFRDFYAFEEHVRNARNRRGLDMVEEWYHFPVFYFSNHQAMIGPFDEVEFPARSRKWDYELEVAIIIGKQCRNITREEAFEYVFGLTILNDWSARDLQAEEVKVGLGPAKGKDFATSLGPFIVTPDEWMDRKDGEHLHLAMEAYINGQRTSSGNLDQLYFSIPQLIERASQDCTLYPGDVLGTGTVGSGCLLEQEHLPWLQAGDEVKLKVERLGILVNTVKTNEEGSYAFLPSIRTNST